jgi:hypothetical protein
VQFFREEKRFRTAWVIFDRAARRFKSGYVGSASNSDGILCGVANGGQCHNRLMQCSKAALLIQ